MALPIAVENIFAVSSGVDCAMGTIFTGASLIAAMLNCSVLAIGSVLMPPFKIPPLSCTLKPSAPIAAPLELAAGVNINLLALMSVTAITWPIEIATPFSV